MFRAPCAHRQEGKLYYTVSGITTLKQVSAKISYFIGRGKFRQKTQLQSG